MDIVLRKTKLKLQNSVTYQICIESTKIREGLKINFKRHFNAYKNWTNINQIFTG